MTTVEDEKGYEIAKQYLEKKYAGDYVDFIETEGQSYLDGYEQGYEDCRHYAHDYYKDYYKPKWHDLRKDPDDLPKDYRECLCFTSSCYFVGYYDKYDKEWHLDEFSTDKIDAWCEFQRFEE